MTKGGSAAFELGIFDNPDSPHEVEGLRIGNGSLAVVRSRDVAAKRHDAQAVIHVHLRGGDSGRAILPGGVNESHLTAADLDGRNFRMTQLLLDEDGPQCVERGMNAGYVGIHLEADFSGLPVVARPSVSRDRFGVRDNELRNPP